MVDFKNQYKNINVYFCKYLKKMYTKYMCIIINITQVLYDLEYCNLKNMLLHDLTRNLGHIINTLFL